MDNKIKLLIIISLVLTACGKNSGMEAVNQVIDRNKIGESQFMNDITQEPIRPNEPKKKDDLVDSNNVKIAGDVDLSQKPANRQNSPTPIPGVTQVEELVIEDMVIGTGKEAMNGNMVTVDYQGWLINGVMFDSSIQRGKHFQFELGLGRVIAGWDQGVLGMKEGGKRRLIIPAELGYGEVGAGEVIPPGATLVFEVELYRVE